MDLSRALKSAEHPISSPEPKMADPSEPDIEAEPKQRRVDLPSRPAPAKPLEAGARVRVYHKRNTRMFLSDCIIGPHEEREILESDYTHPAVAQYVVKLAQ
jgi:hypothetical protein